VPATRRPGAGAPAPRRPRTPPHRSDGRSGGRSGGGRRFPGLLLFLLGILVGAAAFYVGCRDSPRGGEEPGRSAGGEQQAMAPDQPGSAGSDSRDRRPTEVPHPDEPAATEPLSEPGADLPEAPEGVRLALVIDDLGRNLLELDALTKLGVPLSYAVLPYEAETPQVVESLRRRGVEILCHLPMEPQGGNDPGPGALREAMSDAELERSTKAALAAVPGAVGVNNHMGSRLSTDERAMRAVLGVLAARDLFFLDSRTSPQSVGYRVATALGLPAAERQVFLDPDPSHEAIRTQFARFLDLARRRGSAVAIGHPLPETLAVLAEEVPRAQAAGYQFVPVSYLLDRPSDLAAAE
jgi:polysaccharide deacetylase 2 family uncharacterized protein YibQ